MLKLAQSLPHLCLIVTETALLSTELLVLSCRLDRVS